MRGILRETAYGVSNDGQERLGILAAAQAVDRGTIFEGPHWGGQPAGEGPFVDAGRAEELPDSRQALESTTPAPAGHGMLAATLTLLLAVPAMAQHHGQHDERALAEDPRLAPGQIAPVLEGLGDHHHEVTTSSERAQLFFDQGLKLTYGFNHQEALRAFKEAARLDPDCAMAYWGWALVLGPNLNLPMRPEVVQQAYDAILMAVERTDKVSDAERMYVEALAERYSQDAGAGRGALDAAYARAMGKLHAKYPQDTDAATL